MVGKPQAAVILTALMLSSGCLGFFDSSTDESKPVDCQIEPRNPDCLGEEISEEDCLQNQVFTGTECRQMEKPDGLNYGEDKISLFLGEEMQALTPSFTGDGPDYWLVNPNLPSGISIDRETGVISGTPDEISGLSNYIVVGTNNVGSSKIGRAHV